MQSLGLVQQAIAWQKKKVIEEWLLVFWNKIQTHKRLKGMLFIRTKQLHNYEKKKKSHPQI